MRLVLDTNVLIAAFISHGVCNELFEHCALHHELALSDFILDEMKNSLTRKFSFSVAAADDAVRLVESRSEIVQAVRLAFPVCRDPDDDSIIATAKAGQCICIVTGDKDLLDLGTVDSIRIVSPGSFWEFEST